MSDRDEIQLEIKILKKAILSPFKDGVSRRMPEKNFSTTWFDDLLEQIISEPIVEKQSTYLREKVKRNVNYKPAKVKTPIMPKRSRNIPPSTTLHADNHVK